MLDGMAGKCRWNSIWEICSFISQPMTDGGRSRVPDLIIKEGGGATQRVQDNSEKSDVFQTAFFPLKPTNSSVPTNMKYPPPAWEFWLITNEQVERAFRHMKWLKATKLGTVLNCVLSRCADLLTPHIGPIYRVTFTIGKYPPDLSAMRSWYIIYNSSILWCL